MIESSLKLSPQVYFGYDFNRINNYLSSSIYFVLLVRDIKMTNKQLIEKIKKEILGIPTYGFEDKNLWGPFIENYFIREGQIDDESYSSKINEVLSSAALSHTLTHIRTQLDTLECEG